jgi:hypothetical protein
MSVFVRQTINRKYAGLAKIMCEERVTAQSRDYFSKLIPASKRIWRQATQNLGRDGRKLKLSYELREDPKTYALDGLVVAHALGISDRDSSVPLQIFSLFYLAVHAIDDLAEDYPKFYAQFKITERYARFEERVVKEVLPFSYTLNSILSIYRMIAGDSRYAKNGDRIFLDLIMNLGKFTHFFLLEQAESAPERILQIKEREVSGVATSMIADLLSLEDVFNHRVAVNLKDALFRLGSLTQFTDDLRDYDIDHAKGNANLMAGLEAKFKSAAQERFQRWYGREEEKMLGSFHNSGLDLNTELLRAIPWYPSVIAER